MPCHVFLYCEASLKGQAARLEAEGQELLVYEQCLGKRHMMLYEIIRQLGLLTRHLTSFASEELSTGCKSKSQSWTNTGSDITVV